MKKHVFMFFFNLQINVFNIYGLHAALEGKTIIRDLSLLLWNR